MSREVFIIEPTKDGRRIAGETPWGRFDIAIARAPHIDPGIRHIVLVENGVQVGTMTIEIRTPAGTVIDPGDCTPCNQKRAAQSQQPKQDLAGWHAAIDEGTKL